MKVIEKIVLVMFVLSTASLSATLFFILEKNQQLPTTQTFLSAITVAPKAQKIEIESETKKISEIIKAVYLTGWSAGKEKYINGYLENIFEKTEINSVVIDIKDYTGYVTYLSESPEVIKYNTAKEIIKDLPGLIKKLRDKNIYTIARLSVFQDPVFAKIRPDLAIQDKEATKDPQKPVLWKDGNGLTWLDPSSQEAQNYIISIAKDAVNIGFDEINFDYIRFPSDGKISNMEMPFYNAKTARHMVIKNFFSRIRQELPDTRLSVDLFGQTTDNYNDLGIGQIIEDSFEYFDFVCPMVYPSHYALNYMGFENPALYPYDIVKLSMESAKNRLDIYKKIAEISQENFSSKKIAKIRPWLQDFNMGAVYTDKMVKEQITATQEALGHDYAGYLLWNPANIYTIKAIETQN